MSITDLFIILASTPIVLVICFIIYCRLKFHKNRSLAKDRFSSSTLRHTAHHEHIESPGVIIQTKVIGFFHPHCSAGGGGERVLWKAIQVLGDIQSESMRYKSPVQWNVAIFTTDPFHENYHNDILNHVSDRFSIAFSPSLPIKFIHIEDSSSKDSKVFRRFSMVMESLSTMKLAWKALNALTPDVFLDTTGCAFTYIVARILANCKVGAYVHYPTISTDMLSLVWDRRPTYNNNSQITSNRIMTYAKLTYYAIFAFGYGFVGSLAHLVMVNSSWTFGHIVSLWRFARDIKIVYPPCDTKNLEDLPLSSRNNFILSIGQFRPEKDHELQIRSFAKFMKRLREENCLVDGDDIKLVLIGSCRGKPDESRVQYLQTLATQLDVADQTKFIINQPFSVLKEWLGRSSVGMHTMWNEHFGIGVVEMMAAGLITIAHNSGGPKLDIVVPIDGQRTGYLASSESEYANSMYQIFFCNSDDENTKIRSSGRKASRAFSDEVFEASFKSALISSNILK